MNVLNTIASWKSTALIGAVVITILLCLPSTRSNADQLPSPRSLAIIAVEETDALAQDIVFRWQSPIHTQHVDQCSAEASIGTREYLQIIRSYIAELSSTNSMLELTQPTNSCEQGKLATSELFGIAIVTNGDLELLRQRLNRGRRGDGHELLVDFLDKSPATEFNKNCWSAVARDHVRGAIIAAIIFADSSKLGSETDACVARGFLQALGFSSTYFDTVKGSQLSYTSTESHLLQVDRCLIELLYAPSLPVGLLQRQDYYKKLGKLISITSSCAF